MINYFSQNYIDERRWASYWRQIEETMKFNPRSVLVVGKGDGLVPAYLKMRGPAVSVLDSEVLLNPDIEASVLEMPIEDNSFDVALCAEVLEHIPFCDFDKALREIRRVAKIGAVVSLPHFGPAVKLLFKIPFLSEFKLIFKIPYPIRHVFNGEHYWEIGKCDYPLGKIKDYMKKSGFLIERNYIVFENPSHRFFILKK